MSVVITYFFRVEILRLTATSEWLLLAVCGNRAAKIDLGSVRLGLGPVAAQRRSAAAICGNAGIGPCSNVQQRSRGVAAPAGRPTAPPPFSAGFSTRARRRSLIDRLQHFRRAAAAGRRCPGFVSTARGWWWNCRRAVIANRSHVKALPSGPTARCPMLHLAALAASVRQRATYQRRD
jgi:hypothetical protein